MHQNHPNWYFSEEIQLFKRKIRMDMEGQRLTARMAVIAHEDDWI